MGQRHEIGVLKAMDRAAQQWLSAFPYGIDIDPLVFAGAGADRLAVSFLPASYHAWTAAHVHPAEALRKE